jgi:hypothetical protein
VKLKKLDQQPISTDIRICKGLFVKHCIFAEGTYIPQHSHETEHLSVIATGAVRAWANDVLLGDFAAPAGIVIKARVPHLFLALRPMTTVLCIHRVDETGEPGIIDEPHFVEYVEG